MQKHLGSFYDPDLDDLPTTVNVAGSILSFMSETANAACERGGLELSGGATEGLCHLTQVLSATLWHAVAGEAKRAQSGESREYQRGRDDGYEVGRRDGAQSVVEQIDGLRGILAEATPRRDSRPEPEPDAKPADAAGTYPKVGKEPRCNSPQPETGEAAEDCEDEAGANADQARAC